MPAHSFRTLLDELSTIVRNTCRTPVDSAQAPTFTIVTQPNLVQQRAFKLLETITCSQSRDAPTCNSILRATRHCGTSSQGLTVWRCLVDNPVVLAALPFASSKEGGICPRNPSCRERLPAVLQRRKPTRGAMGYGFFKAGVIGSAGLLVYAAVIGFAPIILAAIASRFFKPALLRPVSALQASA